MTIFVTKLSLLRMKKENKTKLLFNASIFIVFGLVIGCSAQMYTTDKYRI